MLTIPGLSRDLGPTIPKQILTSKLKTIEKRRAAIEALLKQAPNDEDYQAQELKAEDQALASMRHDIDLALNPRTPPKRHPELEKQYVLQRERDKQLLKDSIRHQQQQLEYSAQLEETAGNHKQARLLRLMAPDIPVQVCREYGMPLTLLAEIDVEN